MLFLAKWVCSVCGYIHEGPKPPVKCPQCGSGGGEYHELRQKQKLVFDGKPLDVLLVNGSSHHSHNTALFADYAEKALKSAKAKYKRVNLNELKVQHCWCCYSMGDAECTYPCRNQSDDAPALHEMLLAAKAVIVVTPINWNNMSARLKDFLDRLTCIQNRPLLGKKSLTTGKVVGILVNGHEDGAMKTFFDVFLYFQQMGFVLAPFGMAYATHGAGNDAASDNAFFARNARLKRDVAGVVGNVLATVKIGTETKLKDKVKSVCE